MPRTYLPSWYKGPFTEEMVRVYLKKKGINLDEMDLREEGSPLTFAEVKHLKDLNIDYSGREPQYDMTKPLEPQIETGGAVAPYNFYGTAGGGGPTSIEKSSIYQHNPLARLKNEKALKRFYEATGTGQGEMTPYQPPAADQTPPVLPLGESPFMQDAREKVEYYNSLSPAGRIDMFGVDTPWAGRTLDAKQPSWQRLHPSQVTPEMAERSDLLHWAQKMDNALYSGARAAGTSIFNAGETYEKAMQEYYKAIGVPMNPDDGIFTNWEEKMPQATVDFSQWGWKTIGQFAEGAGGLASILLAARAGSPIAKMGSKLVDKVLRMSPDATFPMLQKLFSYTNEHGFSLGLAEVLNDIGDPKTYAQRFASGYGMGSIFAVAGGIKLADKPISSFVLRQVGGRALMGVFGKYNPTPTDLANEVFQTYFLRKGVKLGDVLVTRDAMNREFTRAGGAKLPDREDVINSLIADPRTRAKFLREYEASKEEMKKKEPELIKKIDSQIENTEKSLGDLVPFDARPPGVSSMDLTQKAIADLQPLIDVNDPRIPGNLGKTVSPTRTSTNPMFVRTDEAGNVVNDKTMYPEGEATEKVTPRSLNKDVKALELVTTQEVIDWLKANKIDWDPDVPFSESRPVRDVKSELVGNENYMKLPIEDRARIMSEVERGPLMYDEDAERNLEPYKDVKGVGRNEKTAWLSVDTWAGCLNNCLGCYANKMAMLALKSQRYLVPVHRLMGTLKKGEIVRNGVASDAAWGWEHSKTVMEDFFERSRKKGNDEAGPDKAYYITKLQNLDGFDPKFFRKLQVSVDPLYPDQMQTTMENVEKVMAMDPTIQIALRIRSMDSRNAKYMARQDLAFKWADEMRLPVMETRMRFTGYAVTQAMELNMKNYYRDASKDGSKPKGQFKGPTMGRDKVRPDRFLVCNEAGTDCAGCLGCLKTMFSGKEDSIKKLQAPKVAKEKVAAEKPTVVKGVEDSNIMPRGSVDTPPHLIGRSLSKMVVKPGGRLEFDSRTPDDEALLQDEFERSGMAPDEYVKKKLEPRGVRNIGIVNGRIQFPNEVAKKVRGEPAGLPLKKSLRETGPNQELVAAHYDTIWDAARDAQNMGNTMDGTDYTKGKATVPGSPNSLFAMDMPISVAQDYANEKGQLLRGTHDVFDKWIKDGVSRGLENTLQRYNWTKEEFLSAIKFLRQYSHTDTSVEFGRMRGGTGHQTGGGTYYKDTGRIFVDLFHKPNPLIFLHEAVHNAQLRFRYRMPGGDWKAFETLADKLRDTKMSNGQPLLYGDVSGIEAASEVLSDKPFFESTRVNNYGEGQEMSRLARELITKPRGDLSNAPLYGRVSYTVQGEETQVGVPGKKLIVIANMPDGKQWGTYKIVDQGSQQANEELLKKQISGEIKGTAWAMTGPEAAIIQPVLNVAEKALAKAYERSKSDPQLQRAITFLANMKAEDEAKKGIPSSPGFNIFTRGEGTELRAGKTTFAKLREEGVEYEGPLGPGEKKVQEYDAALAKVNEKNTEQPLLGTPDEAEMMRGYPIPERPSHLEETAPTKATLKEIFGLKDTHQGWFESGMRFFERAGGPARNVLKKVFYEPVTAGAGAVVRAGTKLANAFKAEVKASGLRDDYASAREVAKVVYGRQGSSGQRVLELAGMSAEDRANIDPKTQRVVQFMDNTLLQAFHEINRARVAAGQEEIPWRKDYFSFWTIADGLSNQGHSLISTPVEKINELIAKAEATYENELTTAEQKQREKTSAIRFQFLKRTGKLGPVDLDAFGVFARYMNSAYTQIHMAEAVGVMNKIVNGKWTIDGKTYNMEETQPQLRNALRNYVGWVSTSGYLGTMPEPVFQALSKFGSRAAVAKVGFNAKSVLNQLTSNVHSISELGVANWTMGFADYMGALAEGAKYRAEFGKGGQKLSERFMKAREQGDLASRNKESAFEDFMKSRPKTKFGQGYQKLGEASMKGLMLFDNVTAEITWRAAYQRAMKGDILGIGANDHKYAAQYANETVVRTQGTTNRAEISPFMRDKYGKTFSVLQNFVLNEWQFLSRDVLGIRNANRSPENIAKVMRFAAGAMLVDAIYEDVFHIKSPMNVYLNPLLAGRAMAKKKEEGGNLGDMLKSGAYASLQSVPIVGRGLSPYGGGIGGGLAIETGVRTVKDFFTRKPSLPTTIDTAGTLLGVPGSMAAGRAVKTLQEGGNVAQAMFGATPEQKAVSLSEPVQRRRRIEDIGKNPQKSSAVGERRKLPF